MLKLHYELMSWHFYKHSPTCYELIMKDWNYPSSGFEYRTGYKSASLKNIIHAIWYLTGTRYCVHLTDREMKILDIVERDTKQAFAVFANACNNETGG